MENILKINDNFMFSATHLVRTTNGLIEAQKLKDGDVIIGDKGNTKITHIIQYDESKRGKAPVFTGYFDDNNQAIFVGDKLKSEWNYEVIVVDDDGDFTGELVCDNTHSCKNIPYSLNCGSGYKIIK